MTFDERMVVFKLVCAVLIATFGALVIISQRRSSPSRSWSDADKALLCGVIGVCLLFFSGWLIDGIAFIAGTR